MKTFSTLASTLSLVALAKAQVTVNNDGSIKCASSGNYCAGDSLSSNIIIRCSSGTGVAGNCNDNLAGINPVGVKSFAPCWQSSSTAGDAACSYNGVAYPDQGDSFVVSGASSSAHGYGSKSTSTPVKPGYGASTPPAYSSTSKGGYGVSSSSKGGYGSSSSSSKAGYGSTSTPTPSSSSKAGYTNSTLTKTVTVTASSAKTNLTTTVITSNAGTSTRIVTVTSSGAPVPVPASSAPGSANSNVATTVVPASSAASASSTAQPSQFTGAAAPALLGGKEMALAGLVGVMGVMLGL